MYLLLNISSFCHILLFYWSNSSCCSFWSNRWSFMIEFSICVTLFCHCQLLQWRSTGSRSWTGCSINPLAVLIYALLITSSFRTNSLSILTIFQLPLRLYSPFTNTISPTLIFFWFKLCFILCFPLNTVKYYLCYLFQVESLHLLMQRCRFFFFLSRFSFTDTDDSRHSRGREGTIFYSTLLLPPAREHSDIYLQLCMWDDYRIFLIATLLFVVSSSHFHPHLQACSLWLLFLSHVSCCFMLILGVGYRLQCVLIDGCSYSACLDKAISRSNWLP